MIDSFEGEYRFLSNFSTEGAVQPSVEHHYQAAKTLDISEQILVMEAETPGKAKKLGRKVMLRPDWEEIKLAVMFELLLQKFDDPEIRVALLSTEGHELVEGNFWGIPSGESAMARVLTG